MKSKEILTVQEWIEIIMKSIGDTVVTLGFIYILCKLFGGN